MGTIARGEADTMNVDPEDLYLAGSIFGLEPFLMEQYDRSRFSLRRPSSTQLGNVVSRDFQCDFHFTGRFRYRAAVLIPKNSDIASLNDLKGKDSCHTGYARNAGWFMPLGHLLKERVIQQDCRSLLHTAENFFHRSCLPGRWSKDPLVDMHLSKYD